MHKCNTYIIRQHNDVNRPVGLSKTGKHICLPIRSRNNEKLTKINHRNLRQFDGTKHLTIMKILHSFLYKSWNTVGIDDANKKVCQNKFSYNSRMCVHTISQECYIFTSFFIAKLV